MIHLILAAMLLLATCLLPRPAGAVGKITVDPNVPGAAATEEAGKPDKRLAQKITYEAKKKTVLAILAELSEKTGVTFKAGYSSKDWQVRDRKMNVFAKDTPLAQLVNSIARVMKFKWSLSGEGEETTYRLFMDRRTLLEAEAKKLREEQLFEQRAAEKREKMFEQFASLENLSPEEFAKLREDSPFLYLAATSGLASPMGAFFREVPSALEALASGQELTMSAANLSPAGQQALLQTMQSLAELGKSIGDRVRPVPSDLMDNMGQVTIRLNEHMDEMRTQPLGSFILGSLSIRYPDGNFGIPIMDPESSFAKLIGSALLKAQESGKPLRELEEGFEAEMMQVVISEMKKDESGEPAPERRDDHPDLAKKIKLPAEQLPFEDLLCELAKASELAVVSDSFGGTGMIPMDVKQESELKQLLDQIAERHFSNWDKHDKVIEFRDRHWFRKRAAQIPEAWLEEWRNTLKKTGTLDIGDLAQMAVLTQEQFRTNISADEVLGNPSLFGAVYVNRDILRLYAALSDSQRARLFTQGGLDLRALTPEQWKAAEKAISRRDSSFLADPEARVVMRGTRTAEGKRFNYIFHAGAAHWNFVTPEYVKPKEPKQDKKPPEAGGSGPDAAAEQPDQPAERGPTAK